MLKKRSFLLIKNWKKCETLFEILSQIECEFDVPLCEQLNKCFLRLFAERKVSHSRYQDKHALLRVAVCICHTDLQHYQFIILCLT